MDKKRLLARLYGDVLEWNEWRRQNRKAPLDFDQADLRNGEFANALLGRASLKKANLRGANLRFAVLEGAYLNDADLRNANLVRAFCDDAYFTGANLEGANLQSARLYDTFLSNADLTNTRLFSTSFVRSDLKDVNLSGAELHRTQFLDVDLSKAKGLTECKHFGPSSIDQQTLAKSGELPIEFLRGCGFSDRLIEYLPSLFNRPIQFYSCFISFTEDDDTFAERLYNDLQGNGIRCWRWKEDAKWGRSLIGEIDKAIRLYDKLIVICSRESLQAMPVLREIERALQREDEMHRRGEKAEVLFPIRIDDYIFDDWQHPRKADLVERNIGDFRGWEDHGRYKQAFDRLLRDLKGEADCA